MGVRMYFMGIYNFADLFTAPIIPMGAETATHHQFLGAWDIVFEVFEPIVTLLAAKCT